MLFGIVFVIFSNSFPDQCLLFSFMCSEGLLLRMADIAGLAEAAGARFSSLELIGQGSFGDVYKG